MNVKALDSEGKTVLLWVVQKKHAEIVKLLLDHPDINVNKPDSYGKKSALFWAVQEKNPEIVKLLLSYPKIDANQQLLRALSLCKSKNSYRKHFHQWERVRRSRRHTT